MTNISNPVSSSKPLAFKAFEDLAKNASIDNEATIHLNINTGGRVVLGLEAKSPVAGKKTQALGKPITNLNKITDAQRNGILATEAFKQAIVQRYGQNIANAVEKHLLKRGTVQILTAADLRRNLKVTAAIVKILKATPEAPATPATSEISETPSSARAASTHRGQLSQSSRRRNEAGEPDLPSTPTQLRKANIVSEVDETGNRWRHNSLYISPEQVEDIVGEPAPPKAADEEIAARKPRSESKITKELEANIDGFDEWLDQAATQRKPRSESVITKELEANIDGFDEWLANQGEKTKKP
jgi:hypothetical protein